MKKIFNKKWLVTLMMGAAMLGACTDNALVEAPEVMQEENKDTYVATLIAGLPEEDAQTRLAYEKSDGGIKMTWAQGDQLTATPKPTDKLWAWTFTLSEGAGTNSGTFTCSENIDGYLPQNWPYITNGWTIYYPGSIECEQDWFDKSYLGQKQVGNNNIDHLKDYHSIRLRLTDTEQISFEDTYLDFSGDEVDESMCMKFNLSGFESSKPAKIELMYMNPDGVYESCFHTNNYLSEGRWTSPTSSQTTSRMTLDLEGFNSNVTGLTAYMMMSNYPIQVKKDGKFRVYLTTTDSKRYYCDVTIKENVALRGSNLYSLTCKTWTLVTAGVDGLNDPNGVFVLQEATNGNPGADIIIMGDGFAADKFTAGGEYETIMKKAYNDFFSVEPYKSLKKYFNVYYINAVSEDNHDANPNGLANGAIQGTANTVFDTQLYENQTTIEGNNEMAINYAKAAILAKGGTSVTEQTATTRANRALIMVMVNVEAHAGTCAVSYATNGPDYCNAYSIAYTALGNDGTGIGGKWTTIHEAGGHGFGKLADEYDGNVYTDPSQLTGSSTNSEWNKLDNEHTWGLSRNVDKYWGEEEVDRYKISAGENSYTLPAWAVTTTAENVYWSALLDSKYSYTTTEGLSFYRGGNTFSELYCRPTGNSVMNDQFAENGQFFNAISRWAIWYRLMRLTGKTYTDFKASLSDFIEFDKNLTVEKNLSTTSRSVMPSQDLKPLASPVLIPGRWENGRFIEEK